MHEHEGSLLHVGWQRHLGEMLRLDVEFVELVVVGTPDISVLILVKNLSIWRDLRGIGIGWEKLLNRSCHWVYCRKRGERSYPNDSCPILKQRRSASVESCALVAVLVCEPQEPAGVPVVLLYARSGSNPE